jgi:hypothetical protein
METLDRLWFTRNDIAALCGLSPRHFDDAIRPRAKDAERGTGKTKRFDGPKMVAAAIAYRLEQAAPATTEDGDPLLSGSDSPALERYRNVKADLAERDLAERDKVLVRANVIRDALRPAVSALRGTGDRLVRQFGNEAGDIFNEGVNEFEAAAKRVILADAIDTPDSQRTNSLPESGVGDPDASAPDAV